MAERVGIYSSWSPLSVARSDLRRRYPPGLAQRGLDVADVRAIASVATRTGYGNSLETTLTWTQAQDIAYVLSDRCRDVAMGVQTWQGAIAEDINDGAPAFDARAMNDYLRSVWCSIVD